MGTRRVIRPRGVVPLAAVFVSQETCLAVLGVDARRYLELVVPLCKGDVSAIGKLRLVPLDVAEAAIRALAKAGDNETDDGAAAVDPGEPRTVDEVLARLGWERVR